MKNRFCELLNVEKPVVLAPMNFVCDAKLAAAVCEAGGLGTLGMNCAVEVPESDPKKNGENLRSEIKRLRGISEKPFAVNYLPDFKDMDPLISFSLPFKKIIIEEKVPAVIISGYLNFGKTKRDISDFKEAGVKVIFREVDLSLDAYKEAVSCGADAIVVTGVDGGGHVSKKNMSLISILPRITDELPDIPVIAGGGIINPKSAKAAIAMGADAVYVGTAFLAANECRTHDNFKKAMIEAKGEDIILWSASAERMMSTNNFVGRTCQTMANGGAEPLDIGKHYNGCWNTSMIEGDVENGVVSISSACDEITEVLSAKEIVDKISSAFV